MAKNVNDTTEKIRLTVERCQAANEAYYSYLKKYVKELRISDSEVAIERRKADLGLTMIFKKTWGKDMSKEIKQFIDMDQSNLYFVSEDLDTIYSTVKTILIKRGWTPRKE